MHTRQNDSDTPHGFSKLGIAATFSLALFLAAGRSAFGQSVVPVTTEVVTVVDNDNDGGNNDNDGGNGRTRVVRETVEVTRTVEVPIAAAPPPPAALVIPAAPPPPPVDPPVVAAVDPPLVIPAAPPPPIVLPQVAVPRTGDGSTFGLSQQGSVATVAQQPLPTVLAPSLVSGFSSVTVEAVIPSGLPRTGGDGLTSTSN